MDQPDYLLISEASEVLRTPVATLYRWRTEGTGPPASRVGRKLLYSRADLIAWVESQRQAS